MKKALALALSTLMLAGLVLGCGNEGGSSKITTTEGTASAAASQASTPAPEGSVNFATEKAQVAPDLSTLEGTKDGKPVKIGFTICINDQYGSLMSTAMINKAKEMGAEVNLVEAKENDTTMLNQVKQFVTEGVDAIVVQMTNTKIPQQVMDIAGDIPVVFLNRIPVGDITGPAYYVGSDDLQAGRMQAEALAKFFANKEDKTIHLVTLQGVLGLANVAARTEGVHSGLKDAGFKVVETYTDSAKWQRTDATNMMTTFLGQNEAFDAVASNNDEMAVGAILAMQTKKMDFSKIPVVGVDATKDGCLAVKEGTMYATVYQDAKGQGEGALAVCLSLAHGKEAPRNVDVPFQLVTKENVDQFMQ